MGLKRDAITIEEHRLKSEEHCLKSEEHCLKIIIITIAIIVMSFIFNQFYKQLFLPLFVPFEYSKIVTYEVGPTPESCPLLMSESAVESDVPLIPILSDEYMFFGIYVLVFLGFYAFVFAWCRRSWFTEKYATVEDIQLQQVYTNVSKWCDGLTTSKLEEENKKLRKQIDNLQNNLFQLQESQMIIANIISP